MNKLAPLLLLAFFAALPHLHPSATPAAPATSAPCFRTAAPLGLLGFSRRVLNNRIPAAAQPAAVRALARLLRTYTEVAAPELILAPVAAAGGPYPHYGPRCA